MINVSGIEDIAEESSGEEKSPKKVEVKRKSRNKMASDKKAVFIVHNGVANTNKRRVYNISSKIKDLKPHLDSSRSRFRIHKNDKDFRSVSPRVDKQVSFIIIYLY